ncbi:LOW QUALITY PROTEIN: hypothetical protein QYF61_015535 [Mycteria americana]|uniref:Inositol 1,4,5-trisphosphate receptor-interacting protein-like 1 n=2 Tax=Mycteria americana TaxID=33587 RepID=A0AAN7N9I6_MYCAM|nr:LOW QUALITY PROTEIN: hypothetical protein QYF61_015529 [Mycteria americana]KAK4822524.1 LOW QUALITY PROTEIN: hypothetical protein QYF61_015530 [Mycteria americana]KAK4822526.1 LOW QUALITY PROTEIN: hypothetical protein QYF61_015532 [Mycteria americana]KAK4822529.1 LOW QUALITY PROTEIN: hypothetical protein QYF61_015535 [Mycteria americana]
MAAAKFLIQAVLSIIQYPQMVGDELDEATRERMQQRAEYLSQEMTRLLQELEQTSQEQSGVDWEALIFDALQQWQFWAIAAVLVLLLLFGLWWWLRKRSCEPDSCSDEGSSSNEEDKEEQEEKPSVALDTSSILPEHLMDGPDSFLMVEEVVNEGRRICQELSRNTLMPPLRPAIGAGGTFKGWSPHEGDAVYRLLVPLQPPRGHAFHLELGTAEVMLARNCSLRLECTCLRERLVGDMLCFLHHPEEELGKNQGPSLLGTLCTGPYLDMEKTTRWFHILVKAAWVFLPWSRHCRLTVLPSRRSCKLWLTNASQSTLLIEMVLGVQQDDSDTFLSIE